MLGLEEYIAKRLSEDAINERDINNRIENTRVCVNYVFEYFNNYLEMTPADEITALQNLKIEKYRNTIYDKYSVGVVDWLVQIYTDYGKYMNRKFENIIMSEYPYFLLYSKDSEFRSLSYAIYSKIIKSCPFIKDHHEMIYKFVIDRYKYLSQESISIELPDFTENLSCWIRDTYRDYNVSILNFCYNRIKYIDRFPDSMKSSSVIIEPYGFKSYNYKVKDDLFGLDSLYRDMPKKEFTKGRKQEFEFIMMYLWLHCCDDDEHYWNAYKSLTLPLIDKKTED